MYIQIFYADLEPVLTSQDFEEALGLPSGFIGHCPMNSESDSGGWTATMRTVLGLGGAGAAVGFGMGLFFC